MTTTSVIKPGFMDGFSKKPNYKDEEAAFFGANDPAGPGQRNPNNRWNVGIGFSQVFTPTFTMSVNLGGMKWVEGNDVQSNGFKASSLGLPGFMTHTRRNSRSSVWPAICPKGRLQERGRGHFLEPLPADRSIL